MPVERTDLRCQAALGLSMAQAFSSKKSTARIADARKSHRKQAVQTGKVAYRGNSHSFNCTIRDISEAGARIGLSECHFLPKDFFLIDTRNRIIHEARVVWVAYSQRGVRFLRSYPIDQRLPPELEFLKRL
jgi:hypothetical protein